MPNNFVAIQTLTANSGGSLTFDFTSIPQTYTDLLIFVSARTASTTYESYRIYFNGTDSNISGRYSLSSAPTSGGNPSTSTTAYGYLGSIGGSTITSNTFTNTMIYIPGYTSSNTKTYQSNSTSPNSGSNSYLEIVAGTWTGTNAITQVTLKPDGVGGTNTFVQHSTAYLYGIKNS